jgi:hypothetical protein
MGPVNGFLRSAASCIPSKIMKCEALGCNHAPEIFIHPKISEKNDLESCSRWLLTKDSEDENQIWDLCICTQLMTLFRVAVCNLPRCVTIQPPTAGKATVTVWGRLWSKLSSRCPTARPAKGQTLADRLLSICIIRFQQAKTSSSRATKASRFYFSSSIQ